MESQPKKEKQYLTRRRKRTSDGSKSGAFDDAKNPDFNQKDPIGLSKSSSTSRKSHVTQKHSEELNKMHDNSLENKKTKNSFQGSPKSSKEVTLRQNLNKSSVTKCGSLLPCDVERLSLGYDKTSGTKASERSEFLFSESLIREISEREDEFIRNEKSKSCDEYITESPEFKLKAFKMKCKEFKREKHICDKEWKKKQKEIKVLKKIEEKKARVLKYLDFPLSYDEDLEVKRSLQDCYYHILQLILITTIAMSMMASEVFFFTDKTVSLFFDEITVPLNSSNETENKTKPQQKKTLRDSRNIVDFWAFAENSLLNLLYSKFFNPYIDPVTHTIKDDVKYMYENQIMGVARIRQVRVSNNSCEIHPDMKKFFTNCYAWYSVFTESTEPIRHDMRDNATATAWVYTEAKKLGSSFYWGEMSQYGGGGYYLDLARDITTSEKMLQELRQNAWVTRATRAIFIDFTIYNANANLFCLCKIAVEFLPVGGILPTPNFHTLKLIRYLTIFDFFILGCEFLYLFIIVFLTLREIMKIRREKSFYFLHLWNYVGILILTLSYVFVALDIARYVCTQQLISILDDRYYQYTEFDSIKNLQIYFNNVTAILVFFSWVKLLSFLNFTKKMVQFQRTLATSLANMMMFFPIFITMIAAFSVLAYLLFGHQEKQYNSVWNSFLTLIQAFLGEFNYTSILESNPILGPIFYITFVFFVFFVLVNVFIAIINDAYASVMSMVMPDSPKFCNYIRRGFSNAFTYCRPRVKTKKLNFSMRKKFFFHEVQEALKRAGFQDREIKIFFHKYNINYLNFMDEETRCRLSKDLKLKEFEIKETSEQYQINILKRKFTDLKEKIENLDMRLQPIIDKVDIILHRL